MVNFSVQVKSIEIDLADTAKESDMKKCDHFSILRYVAEIYAKDPKRCWPFSEESLCLAHEERYAFSSLPDPKPRWWNCARCTKDINADGTKDSDVGLLLNTKTIGEKKVDEDSTMVIPTQSKLLDLQTVIENEKETNVPADIAIEEPVEENANLERSQKDNDQKATKLFKKPSRRPMEVSTVRRNKSRKVANPEQERNKGSKAKPPKLRSLSEVFSKCNTSTNGSSNDIRIEEPSGSKRESVRGRKRKVLPENNFVSKKSSAIGETSKNADSDSVSTDSGPIKGKLKNKRFQVVDDLEPSLPCETTQEGINENGVDPGKSAVPSPVLSLLDGKDSVPCPPPSIQRTEKKLSVAYKKMKKPVVDKAKSSLIGFSTGKGEKDQAKPRNGPSINAVSQSPSQDLLNEKRVGSELEDRLGAERYFRVYTPQTKDKPVFSSPDNGHAETNGLRDFASSSKSNTVGFLRSTGVDVADPRSNNNAIRSSFTNFKQHTPTSAEVVVFSSVLQKDASVTDRKGKTVMVQEDHGASTSRSQSHDKKANTSEENNDDYPMDIVELLAKHQHERGLPDKEEDVSNKQPAQEPAHKSKNGLLIDLNETYDNEISHEDNNNTSRLPNPHGNHAAWKDGHFPMGKRQNTLNFFPVSKPHIPPPPPRFGIFPSTQENQATSYRFSGQNRQWLPTMATQNPSHSAYRALSACKSCTTVPQQIREASHPPTWPCSMPPPQGYHNQFSFNMDQSTRPGMPSHAPSSNENPWNFNFLAANGKQNYGPNSEFSFGCIHAPAGGNSSRPVDRAGLESKRAKPMPADAYSNESSIPALHLLSLMDPRLRSNTPADHQVNAAKFTERRFPPVNQSKGFTEQQTGESSRLKPRLPANQFPVGFHKSFAPEPSRMGFPISTQPLGPPSFSFQNGQAPWSQYQHQHQEMNTNRRDMPPPGYNSREKQPMLASGSSNQGKFQLLGASNSMRLPLRCHVADKEKNRKRKADSSSNAASALPRKDVSGPMVCSVNRNPADFTIPEPGNVYMITGESLKVKRRAVYRRKPSLCKQDASKQNKKPVGPASENS